jgi:molybdenum cofactor cytidylyltransferase
MFRLGDELAAQGWRVVLTTTTHISADQVAQAPHTIMLTSQQTNQATDQLPNYLTHQLQAHSPTLLVGEINPQTHKAVGLRPDMIDRLASAPVVDVVINEADGARTLPFKAPANHEPVIPSSTTLVVPMVGIDAVGQPLDDVHVHRPERVTALTGVEPGRSVTPEHIAAVLAHPQGGLKGVPPQARVIALVNKVETEEQTKTANRLAGLLLETPRITAVTIGAVREADPIRMVKSRVAIVVLAAGESRRFGRLKQLSPWGDTGETLLSRAVNVALASRASQVVVVLGCQAEACRAVLVDGVLSKSKGRALRVQSEVEESVPNGRPLSVVVNPNWAAGQSTSVRAGLAALPQNVGAVIFNLADQPGITPAVMNALIERHAATLAPVVWPEYQGQRGNPVLFDRATFPKLHELTGDVGGRPVLTAYARANQVERVAVDEPGILVDIDSPQDLARAWRHPK